MSQVPSLFGQTSVMGGAIGLGGHLFGQTPVTGGVTASYLFGKISVTGGVTQYTWFGYLFGQTSYR